jgi:D-alanine-D-alanine ligase
VDEHGSLGMDAGCIVTGSQATAEIRAREARFGGTFFAEQYVEGREFNAALLQSGGGLGLLPIQEIDFSGLPGNAPPIVDYAAKWDASSAVYHATPRRFGIEQTDPALAAELARLARAACDAFELTAYARVDFRVSRSGEPTVLEVNANPCLAPDAGFAAASAEAGLAYDEVIDTIVRAALPAARKAA